MQEEQSTSQPDQDDDSQIIQRYQAEIDLTSRISISSYGVTSAPTDAIDELTRTIEQSPTSALAQAIQAIVEALRGADPRVVSQKRGWLTRFTGKDLEGVLRYRTARRDVDHLIRKADELAAQIGQVVDHLEQVIQRHEGETRVLRLRIKAGQQYLLQNPVPIETADDSPTVENQLERFARRLTNLTALLASHDMSLAQMKLARSNAINLLDRYMEISTVLVPVWRQNTLAIVSTEKNNPTALSDATKAHESLLISLATLKGTAS